MNTVYHTSPNKIEKITKNGKFDDCLFFSSNIYSMGEVVATYEMDVECLEVERFFYQDDCDKLDSIIEHVRDYANYLGADIDLEEAQDLLDSTNEAYDVVDYDVAGELSWFIQTRQGEAAKVLGYNGAIAEDEQGTVYIIPMFGRENDLKEVK